MQKIVTFNRVIFVRCTVAQKVKLLRRNKAVDKYIALHFYGAVQCGFAYLLSEKFDIQKMRIVLRKC